jgi:hypothetical protein
MKTRLFATLIPPAATIAALLVGAAILCADTYTGTISVSPAIVHQSTTASSLMESLSTVYSYTISSGTGNVAYVNCLYTKSGTIVAAGTNTIDLYGTVLNSFGSTLNVVRVKGMILCPSNSVGSPVIFRPSTSGGFTNWTADTSADGVKVRSGGCFAIFAKDTTAYPVTATTCDSLDIVSTATNSTTYSLYIFGE